MKITWIIENITREPSYTELLQAAKDAGHETISITGDYKKNCLDGLREGKLCVIFNGSIEMSKLVKAELPNCFPVCYNNWDTFLCSRYYSYFGKYLFNDKYAIISLSELSRQRFLYYGVFGKEALIFIRPDSGEKTFQAQLLDIIDLDRFVEKHDDIKHELVVVSTPKKITSEFRIVVSKTEIIDYSLYRYQDQVSKIRSAPKEVLDLAAELLKVGYFPDEVFCLDIFGDSDGVYWLGEITSMSSAGLYSCNMKNIVEKVSEIAWKDFQKL